MVYCLSGSANQRFVNNVYHIMKLKISSNWIFLIKNQTLEKVEQNIVRTRVPEYYFGASFLQRFWTLNIDFTFCFLVWQKFLRQKHSLIVFLIHNFVKNLLLGSRFYEQKLSKITFVILNRQYN